MASGRSVAGLFRGVLTLGCVVVLSACGGDAVSEVPGQGDPEGPSGAAFAAPTLVAVPFGDAPRELTELEQSLMVEPGPYADDAYDEQKVLEAARAMAPSTPQQWSQALLSQIHEDYAEDVQTMVRFDPSIEGPGEGPTMDPSALGEGAAAGANHFSVVLDASGSMGAASVEGTRMEEARAALATFVAELPGQSTMSLRVIGHEGTDAAEDQQRSCAASEVVYDGAVNSTALEEALAAIEPAGWTPLAAGIRDAAGDFPAASTDGIVYVITDGIETCGDDPVQATEELVSSGVHPVVNVIGYQTGDADAGQLEKIAEAGHGTYVNASTPEELAEYWRQERLRLEHAWNQWSNENFYRILQEGNGNFITAMDTGNRITGAARRELIRGTGLVDELTDEDLDRDGGSQVKKFFLDRGSEIHTYGVEISKKHRDASNAEHEAANEELDDVHQDGLSRWTEYYEDGPK